MYTLTFSSGSTTGTFNPDVGYKWTDRLNVVNEANFVYSSSSAFNRSKVDIGAKVLITEDTSVEFFGYIDDIQTVDGGGMNVHATGYEGWLGREHGDYAGSPWTATNNVTIFNALVAESAHITAGSSDSFGNVDFRETKSDSIWNAVKNLSEKTSQDLNVVYSSSAATIGLVNTRQSVAGSRDILNYGKEIGDIAVGRSMPLGNKVLVYGKGEGTTRIKSAYPAHGYSAASQATWGVITKIVEDYSVTTVDEANLLADAEVARYKNPVKSYEFSMRVKRHKTDFIAGDTITLNATDHGLTNEDVRIVEIEKGLENGTEFMNLTVTNSEFARLTKNRDMLIAQNQKTAQQSSTYDQYPDEYSNQHCSTYIGGNSCFLSTGEWNLAGKLYHCIGANPMTCLCGIFSACYGNQYLSFNAGMTVCIPALQVGNTGGVSTADTLLNTDVRVCSPHVVYADCFCGAGGGGGGCWTNDGAGYICTIGNCGLCIMGNISSSYTSLGIPSSPGAFNDVNAACGMFTTCVNSPYICGTTCVRGNLICGTTCVKSAFLYSTGSACIGSNLDVLSGTITTARVNIGGSSACELYVGGNSYMTGSVCAGGAICSLNSLSYYTTSSDRAILNNGELCLPSKCGTCDGIMHCFFFCSTQGNKTAVIEYETEKYAVLKVVESPDTIFEDSGTGELGLDVVANTYNFVKVNFDPIFKKVTKDGTDYQVLLTPIGNSAALYIEEKQEDGFIVGVKGTGYFGGVMEYSDEAVNNKDLKYIKSKQSWGTENIKFDWLVRKKRRNFEGDRWILKGNDPFDLEQFKKDPLNTFERYQ